MHACLRFAMLGADPEFGKDGSALVENQTRKQ